MQHSGTSLNPLEQLAGLGQAFWLDYIRRGFVRNGELARLVQADGLRGVTSNPAIFEKAIAGADEYREQIQGARRDASAQDLFEALAVRDVQEAADVLLPVYEATGGADGFVSLEVAPARAHDLDGTLADARRLWAEVARPNLMIKVPATAEGIPAVEQLISEGINVNVTLLFSVDSYVQAARAYVRGLERRLAAGQDVKVGSVASFFVSRIDSAIDKLLEAKAASAPDGRKDELLALRGRAAIANAKRAYREFGQIFSGPVWEPLAAAGARVQRLLWASTSTKSPAYRDVIYIEELIGPDTVNTMPPATAEAFRDHGRARITLSEGVAEADAVFAQLEAAGISPAQVTSRLLVEGVALFQEAFDKLIAAIEKSRSEAKPLIGGQQLHLPAALEQAVGQALEKWQSSAASVKIWARDSSQWTGSGEEKWLGWLDIVGAQLGRTGELKRLGETVKAAGYKDVIVLGMGGSSLCPEVLSQTFGPQDGYPRLRIVDSTDPAQIRDMANSLDAARTLFIVSSKSGSTLEPSVFKKYFFARQQEQVGVDQAPRHFLAVTDPGSPFEAEATRDRFARIFYGLPTIGGRFSALSNFGMAPAAAMGLDAQHFLERAEIMTNACAAAVPATENPAVVLGTVMGVAALAGRDKITLAASPVLQDLGAWLEQLIAESTGKHGKGIIPVDLEPLASPETYGADRLFVHIRYTPKPDAAQGQAVERLIAAGFPVVSIDVDDVYNLGQEFFRWEFATAVAGSLLGINPFDQPDVEASKVATRKLTTEFEKTGKLAGGEPLFEDQGIRVYADPANAAALPVGGASLEACLRAHLQRLTPGDYFAILAYLNFRQEHIAPLQELRRLVRDATRNATCLGFGPRFLHSTGQAYKGGPNSGVFLQITCDDAEDLAIPGQRFTFGVVKAAQALGDLAVLYERGRRALRLHLGADTRSGLETLGKAVRAALA